MRTLTLLALVAACSTERAAAPDSVEDFAFTPAAEDAEPLPPPYGTLALTGPSEVPETLTGNYSVTGAHPYESIYILQSEGGVGAGPCSSIIGGQCLSILPPLTLAKTLLADFAGDAMYTLPIGNLPAGSRRAFQAVTIRGFRGVDSLTSNPVATRVLPAIYGCTNPASPLYDPDATIDDGSCFGRTLDDFTGVLGPDLSGEGWTQCAGTDDPFQSSIDFLSPCIGTNNIKFACSVDDNETAEYVGPSFRINGANLVNGVCHEFSAGAISPYLSSHILSIDASDPRCYVYDPTFDMYMDMFQPQWGCNGVVNTQGSGRMFVYVEGDGVELGCTDPAASNYDPNATYDDETCVYGLVPGFTGDIGPVLGDGWLQCGGTRTPGISSAQFMGLCDGYSEVRFACSADADDIPEAISPAFPAPASLLDGACDDWVGGALYPYITSHILAVDPSDPTCGSWSITYDIYMDMFSPQWGCGGVGNTQGVGANWVYVR